MNSFLTYLIIFLWATSSRLDVSGVRNTKRHTIRYYDIPPEYALYHSAQIRSIYPNCIVPNHYQLADFDWNSDKDLYYYPLIHPNDFNNFYKILYGQDLRSNANIDSICLNHRWSINYPNDLVNSETSVQDMDRTSDPLSCQQMGTKFAYDCIDESGNSYRWYVLKTNHETWALAYTCWESGSTGWTVYSETPKISYQTKQEVLRHVRAFGFDSNTYLDINYDRCGKTHRQIAADVNQDIQQIKSISGSQFVAPQQQSIQKYKNSYTARSRGVNPFTQNPFVQGHATFNSRKSTWY